MITISLQSVYYIVAIISILCGAAYKLGYENGKHTENLPLAAFLHTKAYKKVTVLSLRN